MAVTGNTREELFRESLAGLVKVLDPCVRPEAEGEPLRLTLEAPDETALLVDFLGEALSRMAVEKKVYGRPRFLNLTDRTLTVDLEGRPVEGFGRDVKAVTYH
jgi:SHS2 domain-containing protein